MSLLEAVKGKWWSKRILSSPLPKTNTRSPIPRHIIIKMTRVKDKEKTPKTAREKQTVIYKKITSIS